MTALQPQLIQTSKETAELIEIIKEETKEVHAKRVIIAADEKMANDAAEEAKAIKVREYKVLGSIPSGCKLRLSKKKLRRLMQRGSSLLLMKRWLMMQQRKQRLSR